ncbi:MAG: hypothetical protein JSR83_09110 [Proteobacteria bacterium]|nr:hypothetical protein [Pseudomonadota bacterium]
MTRRSSKPVPSSLKAAFEADKDRAYRHRRLNIERLAELMSVTPATLYKWIETDSMPVRALLAWQHLTGANNVVRYLASREGDVVISIPRGRAITSDDVHTLQATLHDATGALLGYMKGAADRDSTLSKLGQGLESLAWHRENLRNDIQPELNLESE